MYVQGNLIRYHQKENPWGEKISSLQLPMDFKYHFIWSLETHEELVQVTDSDSLHNYVPFARVIFNPLKYWLKPLGFPLTPFLKVFPSLC